MTAACRELYQLGAIDFDEEDDETRMKRKSGSKLKFSRDTKLKLTRLGSKLAPFPLEPKLAKYVQFAA